MKSVAILHIIDLIEAVLFNTLSILKDETYYLIVIVKYCIYGLKNICGML